MDKKPWMDGPIELLFHGWEHLKTNNAFNNRMAMISFDNAIEVGINVYLKYALDQSNLSSDQKREIFDRHNSFHKKLDLVNQCKATNSSEFDFSKIRFGHNLRNTLYHNGNGISIEYEKVKDYGNMCTILMGSLFDLPVEDYVEKLHREAEYSPLLLSRGLRKLSDLARPMEQYWRDMLEGAKKARQHDLPKFMTQFQDFITFKWKKPEDEPST